MSGTEEVSSVTLHHLPKGEDPFLKLTFGDKSAELTVTLSFDGDFLPLFDLPGDVGVEPTEDLARGELAFNLFNKISILFSES